MNSLRGYCCKPLQCTGNWLVNSKDKRPWLPIYFYKQLTWVAATCEHNVHAITRLHYNTISSGRSVIRSNNPYDKQGACARQEYIMFMNARLVFWRCWWQPVRCAPAARVGTWAHIPVLIAPAATISTSRPWFTVCACSNRPIWRWIKGRPPVLTWAAWCSRALCK
jgi:hypothetical protein